MNLLVVGASYRTTPVALLEQLAVPADHLPRVLATLLSTAYVREAVILSTCNRVEVYAAVSGFHGGLADVCLVLAQQCGTPSAELAPYLYVHYADAAVDHAFRVAGGLDSMVVGEAQILGQLRDAYHVATELDAPGRLVHELMQQALRVGKRVHAETGIDRAGQSVVSAALAVAGAEFGGGTSALAGRPALVIGAGAMGALSVATLTKAGAGPIAVANRGADRAARLAQSYGATHVPFERLGEALAEVDVVITATAAVEPVLSVPTVAAAARARAEQRSGPLVLLDLAVPRDVDPAVGQLPAVRLVDIDGLAASPHERPAAGEAAAAERIVTAEVESFVSWLRGSDVAPTVAALRGRADEVVSAELRRLAQRRPELTEEQRADVAHAIHRVVQRLLHSPTVRVRQLAAEPGGDQYAALLRELFDLEVPHHTTQAGAVPELRDGAM
ncbi:MAG TPA: glutamyl-tRNA reductase [Pilimelia sp.]|nr:glutamyl-tRNA reductase [Pilimelia sp.]